MSDCCTIRYWNLKVVFAFNIFMHQIIQNEYYFFMNSFQCINTLHFFPFKMQDQSKLDDIHKSRASAPDPDPNLLEHWNPNYRSRIQIQNPYKSSGHIILKLNLDLIRLRPDLRL